VNNALACGRPSRQNSSHHHAVDFGEAVIAAAVAVGEFGVIESKQVEDGGVQVVDVNAVFGRTGTRTRNRRAEVIDEQEGRFDRAGIDEERMFGEVAERRSARGPESLRSCLQMGRTGGGDKAR
jgi:hypothetical protein